MTFFNDISDAFLFKIISLLVKDRVYYMEAWKKKLPIIAVCSRWRRLALPLVFNQIFIIDFIVFKNRNISKDLQNRWGSFMLNQEVRLEHLVTNVNLFAVNDRCYLAEDIFINANELGKQYKFFDELFIIFKQNKGNWTGIKNIYLNSIHLPNLDDGRSNHIYFDFSTDHSISTEYNLTPIINFMHSNFTSVVFIEHSYSSDLIDRFSRELIALYSDRLGNIIGEMTMVSRLKYLPQHISHLDLNFSFVIEPIVLPVIIAESLKELILHSVPSDFDWTCFQNASQPYYNNINFKNLEYLDVFYELDNYYSKVSKTGLPYPPGRVGIKMIFPKLLELLVQHCSRNNNLLRADFPNKLDKVWFRGTDRSILLCQQINIKSKYGIIELTDDNLPIGSQDSLDLFILSDSSNNNKIDKISLNFQRVNVLSSDFYIFYGLITETLTINVSLSFEILESVLTTTSNLKFLILQKRAINGLKDSFYAPNPSTADSLSQFAIFANIQYVFLDHFISYLPDISFGLARYFLITCPSLRYVTACREAKQNIDEFRNENKSRFAYLDKEVVEYI